MTKVIALCVVIVAFAGAAFAQPGTGSAPAGAAAAAPPAGSPPAPAAASPATDARSACVAAMNADPTFAAAIVATQHDKDTIAIHTAANIQVQKNQRHVIYAYAAMWIIAAAFVLFLWRRQQALKAEIANLRRDLEAAASESSTAKERA